LPSGTVETMAQRIEQAPGSDKAAIGSRIRDARDRMNMSQHDLALKIGVTAGAVGQWELGITKPKLETLTMTLPKLLGVSRDWLQFGDEARKATMLQTDFEEKAIRLMRRLTNEEREFVMRTLEGLTARR
jgi:transcriptional regulator with XRE-family HTH domain